MGGQLAATILDEATKDDEGEGDTIDVVELVSVDGDWAIELDVSADVVVVTEGVVEYEEEVSANDAEVALLLEVEVWDDEEITLVASNEDEYVTLELMLDVNEEEDVIPALDVMDDDGVTPKLVVDTYGEEVTLDGDEDELKLGVSEEVE